MSKTNRRGERLHNEKKIKKNRFRDLICEHHGSAPNWFNSYSKKEQERRIGKLTTHRENWHCRCDWCLGGKILKENQAELDFRETTKELEMNVSNTNNVNRVNRIGRGCL